MILVDSSVWIDYFNGVRNAQTDHLHSLLGVREVAVGDLILTEVLQGFRRPCAYDIGLELLSRFPCVTIGGREVAIKAARHFRELRALGITVRKTIDCLIATRCIADGHSLLYSDRDFDPFVEHLGLLPCPAR